MALQVGGTKNIKNVHLVNLGKDEVELSARMLDFADTLANFFSDFLLNFGQKYSATIKKVLLLTPKLTENC